MTQPLVIRSFFSFLSYGETQMNTDTGKATYNPCYWG